MKRFSQVLLPIGLVALFGVGSQTSCIGGPAIQLCGEIPSGGCPIGRGGSCTDETCRGLYDCVSGDWTRVKSCGTVATSSSSGTGGGAGGACEGVAYDAATLALEAQGCKPDLQSPDCPAFAATSCSACEACDDFFLCEAAPDGQVPTTQWVQVAFCDAAGSPVLVP